MYVDHFSNWIETKVIKPNSLSSLTKTINELSIQKHGALKRILTDCGLEFKSVGVEKLKSILPKEYSSPAHHKRTDAIKRANQTLFNILRQQNNYYKRNWDFKLEAAANIAFNRFIEMSIYVLSHKKTLNLSCGYNFGEIFQ